MSWRRTLFIVSATISEESDGTSVIPTELLNLAAVPKPFVSPPVAEPARVETKPVGEICRTAPKEAPLLPPSITKIYPVLELTLRPHGCLNVAEVPNPSVSPATPLPARVNTAPPDNGMTRMRLFPESANMRDPLKNRRLAPLPKLNFEARGAASRNPTTPVPARALIVPPNDTVYTALPLIVT